MGFLKKLFSCKHKLNVFSSTVVKRAISSRTDTEALILRHTSISSDHLTPEIRLHLITPESELWSARPENVPFQDPFWGFYWPGGQAVSRYILDNPKTVSGLRVLDVGSGSGACAISAIKSGAASATANDIDPTSEIAAVMNARLNKVDVGTCNRDLIGGSCCEWDCVLCGDIFYDAEFAAKLLPWLKLLSAKGKLVLVGDPGRQALKEIRNDFLVCVAEYILPDNSCLENRGFKTAYVWKFS